MPPSPPHRVPSGEEMVDERGVPVHDDWSMAPDDDRVRFSLSGVTPHSWATGREHSQSREGGRQGEGTLGGPGSPRPQVHEGPVIAVSGPVRRPLPGESRSAGSYRLWHGICRPQSPGSDDTGQRQL